MPKALWLLILTLALHLPAPAAEQVLATEPFEPFNIAFAGAAHFTMQPDGMAIWLSALDGELFHLTDGTSLRLFPIHAFTWHTTDLAYDVDRGTYDLVVAELPPIPGVDLDAAEGQCPAPRP